MSVASKNLFELLGNDDEGTETPKAPVKTVTKTSTATSKANADGTAKLAASRPTGNRAGFSDAQRNFRDVGRSANQSRPTDEVTANRPRGGRGARGRGGPGATRHRNADDRHAKNIAPGSQKQADQAWGATDGDAELKDEQAGETIAQTEQKEAEAEDAEGEAKEPEPVQVPLEAYLAEKEAKKAALNEGTQNIRQVDNDEKKWGGSTALAKEEEEDVFIAPSGGKNKKSKAKKEKNIIAWSDEGAPREQTRDSRGRGGDRGRGGRGGAPRGAPRGGAPRGGAPRGGRGGSTAAPIKIDDKNFPSL